MANVALVFFTTEIGAHDEPHIYMGARGWDDGGYKTLFDVVFSDGGEPRPLGTVKILQRRAADSAQQLFEQLHARAYDNSVNLDGIPNLDQFIDDLSATVQTVGRALS